MTGYARAKGDIVRWLKQDKSAYVTTMFDVYALPSDFPGMSQVPDPDPEIWVQNLETAFENDIDQQRFVPYLQLHEFEAMLFSDAAVVDSELCVEPENTRLAELNEIRNGFATPEHIDNG